MPIATDADQRAVADAVRAWAAKAAPVATSRAAETAPDGWRKHWGELAELGIFAAAVPAAAGGAGGRIVDLAVMLEAAADALVPGPVATTALTAVLLGPDSPLLARVTGGELACGAALDPQPATVETATDGALTVTGSWPVVTGADEHGGMLLAAHSDGRDHWFVVEAQRAGINVTQQPSADISRSVASVQLTDVGIPAGHVLDVPTEQVRRLAVTLFAAEAAGVASWCLRTAVEYAKVREQFGRPIGAFQAIKHLCAEMLCRVEVATALAWDAAVAADDTDPAQLPVAAAAAGALAFDAALDTAKDCIQVLGGIGFTWEHDAHLYLRRALALRQVLGTATPWRRELTARTTAGERRHLHIHLDAEDEHRAAVRAQVEAIAVRPADAHRAALADAGLLASHWPAPYGRSASAAEQLVIDEELHRAGVTRPDLVIGGWAAPTILAHGTAEQAAEFVGPTLRGEITWCQLFSEPGAGSDLASLRTRAERADGGWRLSGQKVWTSVARQADYGICLARTDPDAPKHKGISYFLVDMRSPGIDIRPLREITGEALFNEVFLDDVFVPDDRVVGAVNDGWRLARTTLVNERIAMAGGSSLGEAVEKLVELAGDRLDEHTSAELGGLIAAGLACSVLDVRATLRTLGGADGGAESSVRKLVGVRHRQAVAEAGIELLGAAGTVDSDQLHLFLQTRCLTIAGGTTQVLLSLAAERLLGLPRD